MRRSNRYSVSGNLQAQYEPGSSDLVLCNRLQIINSDEMDALEVRKLVIVTDYALNEYGEDHQFSVGDLKKLHKLWLGEIYTWAGQERTVDISKDDFRFAVPRFIPQLLNAFDVDYLKAYTPCHTFDEDKLIVALAHVHVELILIHPFREGNGRLARLLSTLMAYQAGKQLVNYAPITLSNRAKYISAIHQGLGKNYTPMEAIFRKMLTTS